MERNDSCFLDCILPPTWTGHLILWDSTPHWLKKSLELVSKVLPVLRSSPFMTLSYWKELSYKGR